MFKLQELSLFLVSYLLDNFMQNLISLTLFVDTYVAFNSTGFTCFSPTFCYYNYLLIQLHLYDSSLLLKCMIIIRTFTSVFRYIFNYIEHQTIYSYADARTWTNKDLCICIHSYIYVYTWSNNKIVRIFLQHNFT